MWCPDLFFLEMSDHDKKGILSISKNIRYGDLYIRKCIGNLYICERRGFAVQRKKENPHQKRNDAWRQK